jgi:hypothetical protein
LLKKVYIIAPTVNRIDKNMTESIDWIDVAPIDVVEEKKGSYWVTGTRIYDNSETIPINPEILITWSSINAKIAQSFLSAMVGHAKKMELRPKSLDDIQ